MTTDKKKALVVVSNIQEFKILFLNEPLISKFPDYSFTVATTKNSHDIHLPSGINFEFAAIQSIYKSQFTKSLWALQNQIFFYRNAHKSRSARQKFIINIFDVIALIFPLYRTPIFRTGIFMLKHSAAYLPLYLGFTIALPVIFLISRLLEIIVQRKLRHTNQQPFELIIFGNLFYAHNYDIVRNFSNEDTRIIGLLRNLDAASLKGRFYPDPDVVFCQTEFEVEQIRMLHRLKANTNVMVECRFWAPKLFRKSLENITLKKICYATGDWRYTETDPLNLRALLSYIVSSDQTKTVSVVLRLIHTDNLDRFSDILAEFENVHVTCIFGDQTGAWDYARQAELEQDIATTDLMISANSTICWEARKIGCPACFLNLALSETWINEREHMQYLIHQQLIENITSEIRLSDYLDEILSPD